MIYLQIFFTTNMLSFYLPKMYCLLSFICYINSHGSRFLSTAKRVEKTINYLKINP